MGDQPGEAAADGVTTDWSFVPANPLPTAPRYQRPERTLRGVRRSVWFPIIIGVVVWQWAGLVFGPFHALGRGDWTWIIAFCMTAYSVLPAQICLLNLGLLFGPGPVRHRVFVYWAVSIALLASWYLWLACGIWVSRGTAFFPRDFAAMGVWLPLYVVTLQLPTVSLLFFWRWQLVKANVANASEEPGGFQRFSIRELMIATAVVAVTLVWYRWLLKLAGGPPDPLLHADWIGMWWRTLGIAIAIVPPTLAWLTLRDFNYVVSWCLTVVYSLYVVATGCVIQHYCGELYLNDGTLQIIAGMTLGFSLPMIVGLNLLRSYGWRLERRGKSSS